MTTEQCAELLRRETSMVCRLTLTMLAAVTEDGQYSDSGAFAAAMDNSDTVIAAEGDWWSVRQWQDVARHLALLVAAALAAQMGLDEATDHIQQHVDLVLDPVAFRAALGP